MDPIARALADKWGFVETEQLNSGHCSHVYADADRVLKAPFQGEELTYGFAASLKMSGTVGPRVYESDPATGVVLMERVRPGLTLEDGGLEDSEALAVVAQLAAGMSPLSTDGCVPLRDYLPLPDPLANELFATTERECFLHGDLHHGNILLHGTRWLAIDPKGLVGDPAYECAAFLRNPMGQLKQIPDFVALSRARILEFGRLLKLDPWRICAWSLVDMRNGADERAPDCPWWIVHRAMEELEPEFRLATR